jgi:hypothetical protein
MLKYLVETSSSLLIAGSGETRETFGAGFFLPAGDDDALDGICGSHKLKGDKGGRDAEGAISNKGRKKQDQYKHDQSNGSVR